MSRMPAILVDGVRNVTVEDNDIVHADRGIVVYCWRAGAVDGARWINNRFEAIGTVKSDSPHGKEADIHITVRDVQGRGQIRHLLLKANLFERRSPEASVDRRARCRAHDRGRYD